MTLDDVKRELIRIGKIAKSGDFEAAHAAEDSLHQRVLATVAEDGNAAGALARAALKSLQLKFRRECA